MVGQGLACIADGGYIKRAEENCTRITDAYWPCPRSAVGVGNLIVSKKYLCFLDTTNPASHWCDPSQLSPRCRTPHEKHRVMMQASPGLINDSSGPAHYTCSHL